MSSWGEIRERVTGKWQLPLLVFSVILLVVSFLSIRPTPSSFSTEKVLEHLDVYLAGGFYERAIEFADAALAAEDKPPSELAPVHLRLARAEFARAIETRNRTSDAGDVVAGHYDQASKFGLELEPRDYERLGAAQEWMHRYKDAVNSYEKAVARGVEDAAELQKRILELRRDRLHVAPEPYGRLLGQFMAAIDVDRLDLRLWAVEEKINCFRAIGSIEQAQALLAGEKGRFESSTLWNRFAFLEALVMYLSDDVEEAERCLRTIRNRLTPANDTYAASGWLLGKVVLGVEGPERPLEAISFFEDVIGEHPASPYALASRIGRAEALASLRRHDEALAGYREALKELAETDFRPREGTVNRLISRDGIRASLSVLAEMQRLEGQYLAGADYARLASTLVHRSKVDESTRILVQLARLLSLSADELLKRADDLAESEEAERELLVGGARRQSAEAAAVYLEVARINTLNEQLVSEASWRAAELYEQAGDDDRAAGVYERFARERKGDPLVPRALLRLGWIRQRQGDYPSAIEALKACSTRFGKIIDGAKALIPLAECYLALGAEGYDLAEKTLHLVLDDPEVFTPRAPEFGEALMLLGDLHNRKGRYEEAISVFEEWLDRYGADHHHGADKAIAVHYLLADSYRQSGLTLLRELGETSFSGQREQMQADAMSRLKRARELYRTVVSSFQAGREAVQDSIGSLYLKYSQLYEADCFFEMREYEQALKLYEEVAGVYQDSPTALAAYVQIINCHVFLGEPAEARAALARAEILTDRIADDAFGRALSPETREDWKRYFNWLADAELF
ncbi:MAG: tetratricopeptide repeat protein [Phycisphaerales bacterium]|nr:MAG: tetratricopeptide repeat protein [Phycisphaerales bacterium]